MKTNSILKTLLSFWIFAILFLFCSSCSKEECVCNDGIEYSHIEVIVYDYLSEKEVDSLCVKILHEVPVYSARYNYNCMKISVDIESDIVDEFSAYLTWIYGVKESYTLFKYYK